MTKLLRFTILAAAVLQLAFAQQKGGPLPIPDPISIPAIIASGNVVSGPTVGPDGNAYLIVTAIQTATPPVTTTTQLICVGETSHTINWKATLTGTFFSAPALGALSTGGLGPIFLTTSEPVVVPLANASSTPVSANEPKLVIVDVTSATNLTTPPATNTVPIPANTLSAPQVAPNGTVVYVLAQTSPSLTTTGTTPTITPGGATLYGFTLTGSPVISVKLF